ncbi:4-hydroxy-3-methylbut-2-en-1-yl diphosphate synthase IspG/GcpE [Nocardiopsis mwathae]|uniref:4-hydroxy-3-methylbut-2-en-1-yl diphosphate synthase IspG/GcpE n=1 Tax=Nocardiopsis mwathae TaxID=1472723 RepID=A0A7X0D7P1_9ACTN|nr:4-hydroxy-3-methylbut-2-en-1-yl diphosphate synthase IspG/GcpE [Nocardiopsis mwathae]
MMISSQPPCPPLTGNIEVQGAVRAASPECLDDLAARIRAFLVDRVCRTGKSAVAFGVLLAQGIGDTIRVSLSAPPAEELTTGTSILEALGLRERRPEIVSCPSCGRSQVDVYRLANQVTAAFDGFPFPLRVAVMGCVVNGPGEAREADIGVSCGNGKGQIFVKGKAIRTVPESKIVETLLEETLALAPDSAAEAAESSGQEGSGS